MNEKLEIILVKSIGKLKRNSPTILTFVGASGVVMTSALSIISTPKALELLAKAENEKGEELTKLEKVKVAGKCYIPSVLVGVSTIACIFGANVLNQRAQASLASAYALIENSYREYRKKVDELYGDGTDDNVRKSIAIDKAKEYHEDPDKFGDELLFFDEFSGRFFNKTMEHVRYAEYHFNRNFVLRGYATLNEFYDFLGIPRIECGDTIGWSIESGVMYGYSWVDFNHILVTAEDGDDPDYQEFYRLNMPFEPTSDYDMIE